MTTKLARAVAVAVAGRRWASAPAMAGDGAGASQAEDVAQQWLRAAADNRPSSRKKTFHGDPYEDPGQPRPVYPKRKSPMKRVKALMRILNDEEIENMNSTVARSIPNFKTGDVIRLKLARFQDSAPITDPVDDSRDARKLASPTEWFTGICIARRNRGLGSSFILRNVIDGVAIERGFPTHSPLIRHAEILANRKVARGKLYYLREKPLRHSSIGDATRRPR